MKNVLAKAREFEQKYGVKPGDDAIEGADFVMGDGTRVPISRDAVAAMRTAWTDYLFDQARNGGGGHGARI